MLKRFAAFFFDLYHWFLDRSIFVKVLTVAAALILLTAATGGIGVMGTSRVNRMMDDVIGKELLPITYLYEIKSNLIDTQSTIRDGLLNGDQAELQYLSEDYLENQKKKISYFTTQLSRIMNEEAGRNPEVAQRLSKLNNFNASWPYSIEVCRRVLNEYVAGDKEQALKSLNDNAKQMAYSAGLMDELILDYRTNAVNTRQQSRLVYQGVSDSLWIFLLAAVTVGFAISYILAKFLGEQLHGFTVAATKIADGNLGADIRIKGQRDEIGRLGWAFERMAQNLQDVLSRVSHVTEEVVHHSSHLARGTVRTSDGVAKVANILEKISVGTSEQSRQVERMVDSLEQSMALTLSVNDSARHMLRISDAASASATQGKETAFAVKERIQSVQTTMEENRAAAHQLSQVSVQIEQVMQVVADIAGQINLLALNATIEAARAGEGGKGFAVVAESIGQLSDRTHDLVKNVQKLARTAQQEISQVVESIDRGANEVVVGNQLTAELSETFLDIAGFTERVRELVQRISKTTVEMEEHGREILGGMQEVAAIALKNKEEAQKINEFSQMQNTFATELKDMATQMKESGNRLHQTMNRFTLAKS